MLEPRHQDEVVLGVGVEDHVDQARPKFLELWVGNALSYTPLMTMAPNAYEWSLLLGSKFKIRHGSKF